MSFHPLMLYDPSRFQKSERKVADEGPPFTFTAERRKQLDELLTKYPPDQKRSAVLAALYLVQEQQGYVSANGMRHIAPILDLTPAEVEDVTTYYVMFFREPVGKVRAAGLPDPLVRPGWCRASDRSAIGEVGHSCRGDGCDGDVYAAGVRVSGRVRSRAGRDGQQRALARTRNPGKLREADRRFEGPWPGGPVGMFSQRRRTTAVAPRAFLNRG